MGRTIRTQITTFDAGFTTDTFIGVMIDRTLCNIDESDARGGAGGHAISNIRVAISGANTITFTTGVVACTGIISLRTAPEIRRFTFTTIHRVTITITIITTVRGTFLITGRRSYTSWSTSTNTIGTTTLRHIMESDIIETTGLLAVVDILAVSTTTLTTSRIIGIFTNV